MVYFNNLMIKLLKRTGSWESVFEGSIIMSTFYQNVSLKVADKHYEKNTFYYAAA